MFILSDFLTVSETANETPTEDGAVVNTPKNLSLEATLINHTFLQQVLKKVRFLADKKRFQFDFRTFIRLIDWLIDFQGIFSTAWNVFLKFF